MQRLLSFVLLSLLVSIALGQQRPQVPQKYYVEISASFYEDYRAQIAYDEINGWYSQKEFVGLSDFPLLSLDRKLMDSLVCERA